MYQLVTGPFLWFSFIFFIFGCATHVYFYIKGLDWRLDRVTYTQNVSYGIRGAIRSVFFWLIPFGTRSWRCNPSYTILVFVFHAGVIGIPFFLQAHNIILNERWGIRLWTLSDSTADILTILVIAASLIFILRRIALPEVRILTTPHDIWVLIIAVAPFVTGFAAYHQFAGSEYWLIVHILSGEIMLISIPLTKLSHFVNFFCSRVQLGMDFGIKRGGMKSKGMTW